MVLAAAIGMANAVVWMTAASVLYLTAWIYWGHQDRRYAQDPDSAPAAGAHRLGSRIILVSGLAVAVATTLVQLEVLGPVGGGLTLIAAAVFLDIAHFLWYRDWQQALAPAN